MLHIAHMMFQCGRAAVLLTMLLCCTDAASGQHAALEGYVITQPAQETAKSSDSLFEQVRFNPDSRFLEFGDSSIKFGGYVKADAIVDLDALDNADRFDTRDIATD